jgi:phenylacetate-coenzyme A ligase PaaK-like adenylate-forming protein
MFENIVRPVQGLTHDWQVVFKLDGVREVLEINVESDRPDHEAIREEIFAQATDQYPDLMKNLGIGIFTMIVRVRPPGTIRTKRKLRRLVDQRHFSPVPPPEEIELVTALEEA